MKRAYLSVKSPLNEKKVYPLISAITIGRSKENNVILADPVVSRSHARITPQRENWLLEDQGSANGIIRQGKRVSKETLRVGDSFRIGVYTLSLVELSDSEETAVDYQVQLAESDRLVESLDRCFDNNGIFDRQLFLGQTHVFAPYHERIFPLLLNYLKRSSSKDNRLLILNAIPDLYEEMDGVTAPIQVLLGEFCTPAESINLYDRNILMLAVLLLRHYRKETGVEIETTPEEVLLVQKGLRSDARHLAQETLSETHEQVMTKLTTIHTALIESLSGSEPERAGEHRPRFLFALLREFYILVALIGGSEAKSIVWEGLRAMSNPNSRLYHQPLSKKYFNHAIGLLRIVLRSYLRLVGDDSGDKNNLKALREQIQALVPLAPGEPQQTVLKRFIRLLDAKK
jgi:pSer/pThr/pTyr-binding forkhead associated (FHA) protein